MPLILLEVEWTQPQVLIDLTESKGGVSGGRTYRTAAGVEVTYRGSKGGRQLEQKSWPPGIQVAGGVMEFLLEFGRDHAIELVAGWLFNTLRGKVTRIWINRRSVPVTEPDSLAVLREAHGGPGDGDDRRPGQ